MGSGLLRETDGQYELAGPLAPLAIPNTLQDSLAARLDRLGGAREIAQIAATIGREFSYQVLSALQAFDELSLRHGLLELVNAELVYQRGFPPNATYIFKHALVRDAAYSSLLKSRRQQLHQRIGRILETQFPETVATQSELIAYHFTEAGLKEEALASWQLAGTRAAERSANTEAISHFTTALQLLSSLPDSPERATRELKLQTSLGPVLIAAKGNASQEVEHAYSRARDLCQRAGEDDQLFPVLFGLRSVHLVRGEIIRAHELSEQLLNLAKSENDIDHLIEAHLALGNTSHIQGALIPGRIQFEQALHLYDPKRHQSHAFVYGLDPELFCLSRLVWTLWFLGYPDQAEAKAEELVTRARAVAHPISLVVSLHHAAMVHHFCRKPKAAHELNTEALGLAMEQGFTNQVGQALSHCGSTLAALGHTDEGIAKMREGIAICERTGAVLFKPYFLRELAGACLKTAPNEGLTVVAEAHAIINQTSEHHTEAELWRINGELLLKLNNHEASKEAEECLLKAIEIARQQEAKSWELRATTSLCRLWQQMSKLEEARALLANIYGWFTEGFETGDLREARELLDALS